MITSSLEKQFALELKIRKKGKGRELVKLHCCTSRESSAVVRLVKAASPKQFMQTALGFTQILVRLLSIKILLLMFHPIIRFR